MLELTITQFVVAMLMSLSALFIFIWAVFSGMFRNVEAIKMRAYRSEVVDDDAQ